MPQLRVFTTNDRNVTIGGKKYDLDFLYEPIYANAASAATGSGTNVNYGLAKASGILLGFWFAAKGPATSASGFISATLSANIRINSVSALLTLPGVAGPASISAANSYRVISGIVNPASARVNPGDLITVDYTNESGGSAAANLAASQFNVVAVLAYEAV